MSVFDYLNISGVPQLSGDMMALDYFAIMDRILVKGRHVIRESTRYFKVYLPIDYNDIWRRLHDEKKLVDVFIILPAQVEYIDKVFAPERAVVKENERYKIYLPKKYNSIWEKLDGKAVDLLIVFRRS